MHCYNGKDLARAFRTVRANTITIAEEIPEDKYGYRVAEGTRSVAETLAHLATGTEWYAGNPRTAPPRNDLRPLHGGDAEIDAPPRSALTTKAKILEALQTEGEKFASFLESVPDEALSERVKYPEGMQPADKSRFEMLLSAKEHEMHHRGQLMVIERLLGIVPHLTRQMQARMQQVQSQSQRA